MTSVMKASSSVGSRAVEKGAVMEFVIAPLETPNFRFEAVAST